MTYKLDPKWEGWLEIVVGVRDARLAAAPLELACGWEVLVSGETDLKQNAAWNIPSDQSILERLIHVPQTYGGLIRFISFQDQSIARVRPTSARPWDIGGIWLFNTRTRDIENQSEELHAAGYPTSRGVHEFDFDFLSVKEAIHSGPDGIQLSMIQQLRPPIDSPEAYTKMSRAFNAAIVCCDHNESRSFYVEKLGFKPWVETTWDVNNIGLNLVAPRDSFSEMKKMDVSIVSPSGDNFGSIELLTYYGDFNRASFAKNSFPPALGNLMLRFFTDDLSAKLSTYASNGVKPLFSPSTYLLRPYGKIRSAIIRSPEGVWLEFFELIDEI